MAAILLNQPYRSNLTIPKEKIDTLFSLMNQMDTQQIKQFYMVNNVPLNVNDINGENLIHKAINNENILKKEFHRLNIIKFLIQNDVNPDKPNKENQTPLHLACKMQYADIVKYLIETGVNVNYQDNYGATPFHYALQGQIKLLESDKEIKDFIPAEKKVDINRKETLLEIKKEIWELIKENDFIKSIEKTIHSTVFDDEIKKHSLELYKKISSKITETEEINYFKNIKEEFDIFKNKIKTIVEEKWSNFSESTDIIIHEKEKNSYDFSGNNFSTLKNINIKEQIKDKIKENKKEIKNICKKIYNEVLNNPFDIDAENTNVYNNLYLDFYNKHKNYFKKDITTPTFNIDKQFKDIKNDWDNFNENGIFDENAVDYADNIIDWKELTFMGGSRIIDISFNYHFIGKLLDTTDNNDKILYILCNFSNGYKDVRNLDISNFEASTTPRLTPFDHLIIKMAYYKINNMDLNDILVELNTPPAVGSPGVPSILKYFYYKWEKLLSHKNKASAIYTMFCDYVCKKSSTKLTGSMSFMISILASALNIEEQTIDNAIKTCIKKYFIEKYLNESGRIDLDRIKASINVLLDDNLSNIDYITNPIINQYITDINNKLDLISNNGTTVENKQNIFFELVSLITEAIKNMKNKPLIQDSVSLITYINNSCINNDISCNSIYVKIDDLSNNIISNISNYYTRPSSSNLENHIFDLIKNKNNLHLIPYLYVIMDQEKNNVITSINKLKESKHLGLYYKGLIPYININTSTNIFFDISNIKIIINNKLSYDFIGNKINDNQNFLPLIGNYLVTSSLASSLAFATAITFEYYKFDMKRYRPPIKGIVKNANDYVQYKIKKILSTLLYSAISEKNLYTIIESNSKLSEAFTDIYIYLSFIFDFLDNGKIKIDINNIIKNINDYNAYLLLYHYLFLSKKIYKIPKFNYYLLPLLDKKNGGKFIYFNDINNKIDLNTKYDANTAMDRETVIIDISNNIQANIRNGNSYLRVMENIENNIISGKYIIKSENFIQSKSKKLPPAIIEKLKEFYTYNIKLLLIELYDNRDRDSNIFEKIKELNKYINKNDTTDIFIDNNIMTYWVMSKIVEELIKEKMKYYIESQTNRILYKVIKKKNLEPITFVDTNLILSPQELVLNMNLDDITNGIKHFFYKYQFSKVEKPKLDKFIIYPDEYANSEILKLKYELIIKNNIYTILLDNNSNPYILDSNNQSPIFSLLKNHIPDVLKDIKDLNYNEFTEVNPYNFLLLELTNHTHKLTNGLDTYKDWIDNFVSYQKNEVTTLILSNDKFGNNIPLYLEDSFNVITYIANQYLSESIYEDDDKNITILNCEKNKSNYKRYLFINKQINILGVYEKLENNILQNIIDNNDIEIEKINNTLQKTNKQYKTILESKKKLEYTNNNYKKQIKDSLTYGVNPDLDNEDILKRYKQLENNILTILLSKFINIDLNNSCDLLTFKIITHEQKILNNSLEYIKLNYSLEEVTQLSKFYEITNKISNIYFTFNKYTEYNQVLKFSKELLEFITERFICFPYFMLLNKILTHYFKSIYVIDDDTDIIDKVNYCLTNKILKEDNQSIKTILYNDVPKKLVLNAVQIFDNQEEESLFSPQSTKDIFDTLVNLLTINSSLSIPEDSPFFKTTIKEINSYFDTFVNKTILNWLVVIENVFKFNINQGRIIQSIYNLHF